jgi:hypothetical protein
MKLDLEADPGRRVESALRTANILPTVLRLRIGKVMHGSLQRLFPLTAVYAFTNYCSQGQTTLYVLVDSLSESAIGRPYN